MIIKSCIPTASEEEANLIIKNFEDFIALKTFSFEQDKDEYSRIEPFELTIKNVSLLSSEYESSNCLLTSTQMY